MAFGPGIQNAEAPVDAGLSLVPLVFQGLDLAAEGCFVGEPLPQATAGEDAELDLGHVQPTAVLGVDSGKGQKRTLREKAVVKCAISG